MRGIKPLNSFAELYSLKFPAYIVNSKLAAAPLSLSSDPNWDNYPDVKEGASGVWHLRTYIMLPDRAGISGGETSLNVLPQSLQTTKRTHLTTKSISICQSLHCQGALRITYFFFNSQEALQLPLQNPYCCMQYAYNLNIVISHDSAPWPSCFYICHSLNTIFWSPKNVVPTLKCASMSLWCLSSVSELSNVSAVSALFIFAVTCDLSSAVQRIVGQNSQKCGVHLYDILVFFGTLHFTFSHWDILNIFVTY